MAIVKHKKKRWQAMNAFFILFWLALVTWSCTSLAGKAAEEKRDAFSYLPEDMGLYLYSDIKMARGAYLAAVESLDISESMQKNLNSFIKRAESISIGVDYKDLIFYGIAVGQFGKRTLSYALNSASFKEVDGVPYLYKSHDNRMELITVGGHKILFSNREAESLLIPGKAPPPKEEILLSLSCQPDVLAQLGLSGFDKSVLSHFSWKIYSKKGKYYTSDISINTTSKESAAALAQLLRFFIGRELITLYSETADHLSDQFKVELEEKGVRLSFLLTEEHVTKVFGRVFSLLWVGDSRHFF